MKTAVLSIAILFFCASLFAQDVPLVVFVSRPVSTVLQFPMESDQWSNSPLMKNKPMDPMSTVVLPPAVPPKREPLPPSILAVDTVWLENNTPITATGVFDYDSSKTDNGLTLLDQATRSCLVDMNGKILKKLPFGFPTVFPDGSMVGQMGAYLVKYDADMNLLWKIMAGAHHEITTDANGAIYLLSSDSHEYMGLNIRFDELKIFSADGDLIYTWTVYDHLKEFFAIISKSTFVSGLYNQYDSTKGIEEYIAQDPSLFFNHETGDTTCNFELTHFNSIQVLPDNDVARKIPAFKKGNLLLSFNPYACYGILDTSTHKIEWVGYLPERTTLHTPILTATGTILIFQNSTPSRKSQSQDDQPCMKYLNKHISSKRMSRNPPSRNWVSVSEYNPLTGSKVWEYTADPKESLHADGLGSAQRLWNGNTLVCVATELHGKGGRIFEVTPEKKIVWSYISPEIDHEHKFPCCFYRAKRVSYDIAEKVVPGFKH